MLIWGLQFGVGEIILGLKLQGPKNAICGLKFGVVEIIWGLIFLVGHSPSHFLSIKFFSKLDSWLFGVFEKVGLIICGSSSNVLHSSSLSPAHFRRRNSRRK